MKAAFQTRPRAMFGVIFSILSLLIFSVADVCNRFIHDESVILLTISAIPVAFIGLVFYFADAFRYKNMPIAGLAKIINTIVLLVVILGIIPIFIILSFSDPNPILFQISILLYILIPTILTIISVAHDVRKCKS